MVPVLVTMLAVCLAVLTATGLSVTAADFSGPNDVTLYLYTKTNPGVPENLLIGDDAASPSFNPENPTRIFIHGYISSAKKYEEYPKAYFNSGLDYNVVLVDWEIGSWNSDIMAATNTSILVAEYVGEVVNYFIAKRGLDADKLHIVGHSMGGHMAGIVGHRVRGVTAQMTGLDPANYLYRDQPLENQIDHSDAKFVQIIHSNAGKAGIEYPRGHVDVYPNGGTNQTGCTVFLSDGCSHNMVVDMFLESINTQRFVATKCDSYNEYVEGLCSQNSHIIVGENVSPESENGVYYLRTSARSPLAEGDVGL